jgi:Porin PorA
LLPVLADSYSGSQASVQAVATDAKNGSNRIQAVRTTVPIVAAVVGLVLVVVAVILGIRG